MQLNHIRLPVEILFMVIDQLSFMDDLKTLLSFSETCRVLNLPSRKRTFSKIALGVQKDFLDAGTLVLTTSTMGKLFTSTPTIATYINRATIDVVNYSGLDGELLFPLLQKLCSLTSLRLTSEMEWNVQSSKSWKNLHPAMQRCIHYLLQIPSLLELEIFRLRQVPISLLFAEIPQIRSLRLHSSTIANRMSFAPSPIRSPLTLLDIRRKSINSIHHIISEDIPYVDLSGLKQLYIVLEERSDMIFLDEFLKLIRALDLLAVNSTCLNSEMSAATLMSAPSLRHVRELRLEYSEGKWNRLEQLLVATLDALLAIQNKGELERLIVRIRCLTVNKKDIANGLKSIDMLLAGADFRNLKAVELCIEPAFNLGEDGSPDTTMTSARENILQHFVQLNRHRDRNFKLEFAFRHHGHV